MKTKIVCSLIIGLFIAALFPGHSLGNEVVRSETVKVTYLEERKAVVENWLECARAVAQRTFDHEAYEIVEFLQNSAIIAVPVAVKGEAFIKRITGSKGKEWFNFLFLFESDREIAPFFRDRFDGPVAGSYVPARKILIIRDSNISDTWKGLILLHEGKHAKEAMQAPYNWDDQMIYSEREVGANNFQIRLATAIGGEDYKKALQREINRIESALSKTKELFHETMVGGGKYDEALDKAFGTAKSEDEIDLRRNSVWIDAYFHIIDKRFGENSKQAKVIFLKNAYIKRGVLK